MYGNNVQMMRVTDTTVGSLCMNVNQGTNLGFKISQLYTGVDLYNQTLTCNPSSTTSANNGCVIKCGDKIKQTGETSTNCKVDATTRSCPLSRRLLWGKVDEYWD